MKIENYEQGRSFLLSHNDSESLSKGDSKGNSRISFILFFLAFLFFFIVPNYIETKTAFWFGTIILFVAVLRLVLRPNKFVLIIDLNRDTNVCFIAIRDRNKKTKKYKIPLGKVRSIRLVHLRKDFTEIDISKEKGTRIPIKITIEANVTKKIIIDGYMEIDNVDLRDKMLDFGKRLAQVSNMACGNIVQNDPQVFDIQFFQKDIENLENKININTDTLSEHPDLENFYKTNSIKKDKILDKIICEEWDYGKHRFTAKLIEYYPKSKLVVEYERSKKNYIFFYLLSYTTGFCIITFFGINLLSYNNSKWLDSQLILLIISIGIGALFGIIHYCYKWASGYFQAVCWSFDFKNKKLYINSNFQSTYANLDNVKKVILYRVKTTHTETTGTGSDEKTETYYCYNGIVALSGGEVGELLIGETGRFKENQDSAYSHGLAYASIFTKALDIPFVFKEKNEEMHDDMYYYDPPLKKRI